MPSAYQSRCSTTEPSGRWGHMAYCCTLPHFPPCTWPIMTSVPAIPFIRHPPPLSGVLPEASHLRPSSGCLAHPTELHWGYRGCARIAVQLCAISSPSLDLPRPSETPPNGQIILSVADGGGLREHCHSQKHTLYFPLIFI